MLSYYKRYFSKSKYFYTAKHVIKTLKQNSYVAFIIGGWIRNKLLGFPTNDIDIATSATPIEIKKLFIHTIDIGIKFGTVNVVINHQNLEITTFRTEGNSTNARHPDSITWTKSIVLDSTRRDFSINAIYYDPLEHLILDPQNGIKHIQSRVICTIGSPQHRFQEDRLRILRAARLAAILPNFSIHPKTLSKMKHMKIRPWINTERITLEFRICSYKKSHMCRFLDILNQANLIKNCLCLEDLPETKSYYSHIINVAAKHLYPQTNLGLWMFLFYNHTTPQHECTSLNLTRREKAFTSFIKKITICMDQVPDNNILHTLPSIFSNLPNYINNSEILKNCFVIALICTNRTNSIKQLKQFCKTIDKKLDLLCSHSTRIKLPKNLHQTLPAHLIQKIREQAIAHWLFYSNVDIDIDNLVHTQIQLYNTS